MSDPLPNIFADFEERVEEAPESRLDSIQDEMKGKTFTPAIEPRALFNGRKPSHTLMAERPEHRAIIMMKASAMTDREIAAVTGLSATAVGYIVKQPWAVEQIVREIEQAGREPVMQLLKVSAMDAAQKVLSVMNDPDASKKVQLDAANHILDRVFGKASQPIQITEKPAAEFTDDELAKIAAQGKRN